MIHPPWQLVLFRDLGLERGHRTLVVTRKGGKVVTVPLAPRTARAIDLPVGERSEGPVFLAADGRRLDRHGAARVVRRVACHAGITKPVGPHTLRHAFITAAQVSGVAVAASFGRSRERRLPAPQRAACPAMIEHGPCRRARDLHCHHPLASGQALMQPVWLQLVTA